MSIDLMEENCFSLDKIRTKSYHSETITDAEYVDDLTLLVNTFAQADSQQHCIEKVAISISLHMNSNKTEFMCFKQDCPISSQNGKP